MLPTKSLKITVKAPHGTKLGDTVIKKAQEAAQAAISQFEGLYKTVAGLKAQGIAVTVEELLSRRAGASKAKAPAKKKARRKKARRKVARKAKAVSKAATKPATKAKPARKKSRGKSKRTVLSADQRKNLTDRLKAGATAAKVAAEFGVSTATVNNIKRAAGLTKPRGKGAAKAAKAPAK